MNRKSYPSDLTDKQWRLIKPHLPREKERGRPRKTNLREVINAFLYMSRSGCPWSMIPGDFSPRSTLYDYFKSWRDDGTLDEILRILREEIRVKAGRNRQPSASIIDSQTTKTASVSENVGYDGAKKIKGRKRHLAVDVLGLPLAIVVHCAAIDERSGAKLLMQKVILCFPGLLKVWADGGYTGPKLRDWFWQVCHCILEIVKRPRKQFQIVKWRWIVERSFGWLNWQRRLSKDYEYYETSSEAWIKIGFMNLMVHRLAPG
jgi:putative transposase